LESARSTFHTRSDDFGDVPGMPGQNIRDEGEAMTAVVFYIRFDETIKTDLITLTKTYDTINDVLDPYGISIDYRESALFYGIKGIVTNPAPMTDGSIWMLEKSLGTLKRNDSLIKSIYVDRKETVKILNIDNREYTITDCAQCPFHYYEDDLRYCNNPQISDDRGCCISIAIPSSCPLKDKK
jgi:predicted nucleic-acid-binding Zn-ribbon protein